MSDTLASDHDTLRATPLDVGVFLGLSVAWTAMFGLPVIAFAAIVATQLRCGVVWGSLAPAAALAAAIGFAAFLMAYLLAGFIFTVTFGRGTIAYRDAVARRVIKARDIAEVCFLDSVKGRRYIVIRAGNAVHGVSNMLWSTKDFSRLCDHLQTWRSAGGFSFPIASDITYGHATARDLWFGSRKLPREYRRYWPLTLSIWAAIALIAEVVAFLHG